MPIIIMTAYTIFEKLRPFGQEARRENCSHLRATYDLKELI